MAEGYGVKTSEKEGTGLLWVIGGALVAVYLLGDKLFSGAGKWGSDIGSAFNFGDPANWLNRVFTTTGETLGDFGHFIDLTDKSKYDWLAGPDGILDNTGDWLSDVGHFIDLTDESKYDWLTGGGGVLDTTGDLLGDIGRAITNNPVTDFVGWLNPWD